MNGRLSGRWPVPRMPGRRRPVRRLRPGFQQHAPAPRQRPGRRNAGVPAGRRGRPAPGPAPGRVPRLPARRPPGPVRAARSPAGRAPGPAGPPQPGPPFPRPRPGPRPGHWGHSWPRLRREPRPPRPPSGPLSSAVRRRPRRRRARQRWPAPRAGRPARPLPSSRGPAPPGPRRLRGGLDRPWPPPARPPRPPAPGRPGGLPDPRKRALRGPPAGLRRPGHRRRHGRLFHRHRPRGPRGRPVRDPLRPGRGAPPGWSPAAHGRGPLPAQPGRRRPLDPRPRRAPHAVPGGPGAPPAPPGPGRDQACHPRARVFHSWPATRAAAPPRG